MSIIVFDWDDTLYPTTCVKLTPHLNLSNVAKYTLTILLKCLDIPEASVFIITNASKLWVLLCLSACTEYNKILDLLLKKKIQLISSKDVYYKITSNYVSAKKRAFEDILQENTTKLISIGDSNTEFAASGILRKQRKMVVHRIKLCSRPSVEKMLEQFELLGELIVILSKITESQDINYEKERNKFIQK